MATVQIKENQLDLTTTNAAIAAKLDSTTAASTYLSKSDAASTYETQTDAASTYLSKTDAASTYLTQTDASSTYETQSDVASTYLSQTDAASTYLTQSDANSTYLTQSDAASTYATQSALTSGLAGKQDTLSTAQLAAANSGVTTSTVAQVQTNKEDIAAIDAELDENRPWQKPAGWIDIRSAALPNSVYFLVGHSADYQTYPTFSVRAEVSNSGTYDVYVDGVKKATTASGSGTTLDWATLNLTSGYDVTTPALLKTHVVRVTPSTSSNTLSAIRTQNVGGAHYASGLLWVHFTTSNFINISYLAGEAGYGRKSEVLASITSDQESLHISNLENAFSQSPSLEYIPVLEGNNTEVFITYLAYDCPRIKKIQLKNIKNTSRTPEPFYGCERLKEIKTENCQLIYTPAQFRDCRLLKMVPNGFIANTEEGLAFPNMFGNCISLEPFFLDFASASKAVCFTVGATSDARVDGLKGLAVSPNAPYNSSTFSPQIDVSYTGLDRSALVNLFNSMPTVSDSQVCNVTGATGASDLTSADLAIATGKGWTVTR